MSKISIKRISSILIAFVLVLMVVGLLMLYINLAQLNDTSIHSSNTELSDNKIINNVVIIKNGIIENENLIDEFMEKANYKSAEERELNIIQDDTEIKVKYIPGQYAKDMALSNIDEGIYAFTDGTIETRKTVYGYYALIVDGKLKGEYTLFDHSIKRKFLADSIVLYFDAPLIEYISIPEICKYSIESSNYVKWNGI